MNSYGDPLEAREKMVLGMGQGADVLPRFPVYTLLDEPKSVLFKGESAAAAEGILNSPHTPPACRACNGGYKSECIWRFSE